VHVFLTAGLFSLASQSLAVPALQVPPVPLPAAPLIVTLPVDGKNLSGKWQRQIDAANACRRAFYGQDYLPQPAIWKISDADTTIFLLGTVHALPGGFEWRTPQISDIIRQSDSLITETGGPAKRARFAALLKKQSETKISIADRIFGERRAKWIGMSAMMPEAVVQQLDRNPTWYAALAIGGMASRFLTPSFALGVDPQLEAEFARAKKPIDAMEEPEPVLALLSAMPEAVQAGLLVKVLDDVGTKVSLPKRMTPFHAWAKGEGFADPFGHSAPEQYLRDRLLGTRNAAWVDVVRRRMARPGVTLVAVGAAHLSGTGSLIDLLAAQGMAARRISPTSSPVARAKFEPVPTRWEECADYQFGRKVPAAAGTK
jgi:uncharacterized protein YbaP (TraB family)